MTRKDYIVIAGALQKAHKRETEPGNENTAGGVRLAGLELAFALKTDNANFNTEHFMAVVRGEKDLHSKP